MTATGPALPALRPTAAGGGRVGGAARLLAQPGRDLLSVLARRLIMPGHFEYEADPAARMLAFVERFNLTSKPLGWQYTGRLLTA